MKRSQFTYFFLYMFSNNDYKVGPGTVGGNKGLIHWIQRETIMAPCALLPAIKNLMVSWVTACGTSLHEASPQYNVFLAQI